MRIGILTDQTYPHGMAATARIRCYAKALCNQGNNVAIFAPSSARKLTGRVWLYRGEESGIEYRLILNKSGLRNRWLNYIWHSVSSYCTVMNAVVHCFRYDTFIIYIPSAWPATLAVILLRLFRRKVVYELNEYPYATDGGKITKHGLVKAYLRFVVFRLVFPSVNGAIVISKKLEALFKRYASSAPVIVLPIMTDQENECRLPYNHSIEPYLFHAGTLSDQKDGIVAVFRAFVLAHEELASRFGVKLRFIFTSKKTGSDVWKRIDSLIRVRELQEYLTCTGYLGQEELTRYEQRALALVVNKPLNLQNEYNFPTKLASYLASGRPVVAAARDLELNRYLQHGENAIVVPPNDASQIAAAIVECYVDPRRASDLGLGGIRTVNEALFYKVHAAKLSDFVGGGRIAGAGAQQGVPFT